MNIRVIYNDLGTIRGYTTLTNSKKELMVRLRRLGVQIEHIEELTIDGERYSPNKLQQD